MDRIDFLWWLKFSPAFEVNRIQCGWIRCVREMSLQFHWAEANAVQRNCFSMHRKYFRITKTDSKCIQRVWYCAYIQKYRIVNTMADLQWQISLLSTQNQMNPLSFVSRNTFLTHTEYYMSGTAMECLFCTALLCQPFLCSHLSWLTKQRALRQIINIIAIYCEWVFDSCCWVFKIN